MLRLFILSAWTWLALTSTAAADPVTAAVVTFLGVTGTAAAVATFVVNTVLYTAASIGLNKLFGPKAPKGGPQGAQDRQASVTTLAVGEVPREAILGEVATGGSLAAAFNYGGQYGTDWVVKVIVLADHRCDALLGFYVNDAYVPYLGVPAIEGYNGQLVVHWRDGQAAQAFPEAELNEWRASPLHADTAPAGATTEIYQGMTYVVVAYRADAPDAQNPVWSGHPTFLFRIRGKRCYDPRKDTTVGGSGLHRWNDPATWEWTSNAAVCRYNWVRGVYFADHVEQPEKLLIGRGLSDYEAPPQRVFAYANLCDELVADGRGGTEPRYTVNGVVRSTDSFIGVEEMFQAAMAGRLIQPSGGIEVEPGQAKTPIYSITDDDLVVGAPVHFSDFGSDSTRVNTVIPRYVEPAERWVDHAGPVSRNLDDIAADRGPREETLPMSLVTSAGQAQRNAEIYRKGKRLERTAKIVVPPLYAEAEEGDWIQWTSARHTKGLPVAFRITAFSSDQGWQSSWTLEETSFDVYGFGGAPLPNAGGQTPSPPPGALALAGVDADAIQLEGDGGALVPAIRFTWTTPADAGIQRIRAEIRRLGFTEVAPTQTDAVGAGVLDVTNGVAPGQLQARLVPLGAPGRPILPSAWIDVVAGDLVANDTTKVGDLTAADIAAAVAAAAQMLADLNAAIAEGNKLAEVVTANALRQTKVTAALKKLGFTPDGLPTGPFTVEQRIRTDLTIQEVGLIGVSNEDRTVFELSSLTLNLEGEPLAERINVLYAADADAIAQIVAEESARITADGALTSSVSALSATVGTNHSFVLGQLTAQSTATTSLASELHLLGAKNGAGTLFLLDLSKAIVDGGQSLGTRLSGIDSSFAAATASLASEASARTSADSAFTSQLTTLNSTVGGHTATLSTQSGTLATLDGRTQAYMQIVAAAGSDPAYLKLLATGYGSAIMLAAQAIALFNTSGGSVTKVMELVGGNAHFANAVYIGSSAAVIDPVTKTISFTSGSARVVFGLGFGASANLIIWVGSAAVSMGSMTKANAIWAIATDLTNVGVGGASFGFSTDTVVASADLGSAGYAETNTVHCTAYGFTGTPNWYVTVSGGVTPTAGSWAGNTFQTEFSKTLGTNQTVEEWATITCVDGGSGGSGKQVQQTIFVSMNSTP